MKIENQLIDRVWEGKGEISENVPGALLLKFSTFLIISQINERKEMWILCQAAPGLGQRGVRIFVFPGLIVYARCYD